MCYPLAPLMLPPIPSLRKEKKLQITQDFEIVDYLLTQRYVHCCSMWIVQRDLKNPNLILPIIGLSPF